MEKRVSLPTVVEVVAALPVTNNTNTNISERVRPWLAHDEIQW